jgi:hypothetical protein
MARVAAAEAALAAEAASGAREARWWRVSRRARAHGRELLDVGVSAIRRSVHLTLSLVVNVNARGNLPLVLEHPWLAGRIVPGRQNKA